MSVINDLLTPPNLKFLQLIPYIIYFMMLFHLPYIGMVLGSSVLSVVYNKHKPVLSEDFLKLALGRTSKPWLWIGMGILPAATLAVLYKMLLFNSPVPVHHYLLRLTGLLAAAFIILTIYRRTRNIIIGAFGALAVFLYSFHFINVLSLLVFPEKWPFLEGPMPYPLFSITPLVHFGGFLFLSLAATGAAILFFFYKWHEMKLAEDSPHYDFLRYHGYGLLLAGALLLPLIVFWDLLTLPAYSLSIRVFVLSGLTIVVLTLVAAAAVAMIRNYQEKIPRHGITALIMTLVLFALVIGKNQALRANSSLETIGVMKMDAKKAYTEIVNKREEMYAKNMKIDEKAGELIFNQQCTACHSFDQKILGPPFNSVLPKYTDDPKKLEAFLKNPTKVDPAYPSMPNPGLTTMQVKSVVKFLMIKMGVATDPPGSDAKTDTDSGTGSKE